MASVLLGDRQRLTELMEYSCAKGDLTWEEVAKRAGRSVALVRNIRTGRAPLTSKSKRAIERGLDWPEGAVDAIMANDPIVIAAIRRGEWRIGEARPEPGSDQWWEDLARKLPEKDFWEVVEVAKRIQARSSEDRRG